MTYAALLERQETLAVRMAREGWIIHPIRGRIPFMARPYQRALWNDKSRRRIICKARQIGMSQAVGAEVIQRAMKSQAMILLISRNEDQAIQLLNYCKTIYYNLASREVELAAENSRRMTFTNGSVVVSLPANKSTGRGYPATHIYIDEAAHMLFADMIWQSIAPAVASGGTITMLSSPLGPANLFGRTWRGERGAVKDFDGTAAPDGTWSRHHIPWQQNPDYDNAWFAQNRGNYSDDEWASEFEASLAGSGEVVFKPDYLEKLIEGWIYEQPEAEDGGAIYGDLWYAAPVPGRLYVSGWDIGRKNDPTVGITLDVTDPVHQLVCFERFHRMPYDEIEERIFTRYQTYPGWHAMDATGIGDPIHEALTLAGLEIIPVVFSRVTKPNIVNELVRSTEHEILKLGIATIFHEMQDYRRKDEGLVQDTVMALGIAEYTARHIDLEQTYEDDSRVDFVSRNYGSY